MTAARMQCNALGRQELEGSAKTKTTRTTTAHACQQKVNLMGRSLLPFNMLQLPSSAIIFVMNALVVAFVVVLIPLHFKRPLVEPNQVASCIYKLTHTHTCNLPQTAASLIHTHTHTPTCKRLPRVNSQVTFQATKQLMFRSPFVILTVAQTYIHNAACMHRCLYFPAFAATPGIREDANMEMKPVHRLFCQLLDS